MIYVIALLLGVHLVWGQQATLTKLTNAAIQDGAVCLDGTPSALYYRPGTGDGVRKWFLHHQGGGYCTSLADCYGRSQGGLGSSKSYSNTMDLGGGYFSNNAQVNPLMYNWNMVFFPYCDGGFFTGNNANVSEYNGNKLYFRGNRNEIAYLQYLSANLRLMEGTDFVIGGCSAGGLATFFHLDWWRQVLPPTSAVKGLPDSGWILDYEGGKGPALHTTMLWIFNTMNATSGMDQSCVAAHVPTGDVEKCMFIEGTTPHITTPLFPLQSQYDSWQTDNVLGSNDPAQINAFGKIFEARFKTGVLWNANNGCFLDSCFHHCGFWNSIAIDNTRSGVAFRNWYNGQRGVFLQEKAYPCNPCCNGG